MIRMPETPPVQHGKRCHPLINHFFPEVYRAPSETSLQLSRGFRCGVDPGQRNLGDHCEFAPSIPDITHAMHRQSRQVPDYTNVLVSAWINSESPVDNRAGNIKQQCLWFHGFCSMWARRSLKRSPWIMTCCRDTRSA